MMVNGIKELETMLLEVKLLRQLLPKLLPKLLMLPITKRLLPKLLRRLPLIPTLLEEIRKVLPPTPGMSNGSPRLFHNHLETLTVLIDN